MLYYLAVLVYTKITIHIWKECFDKLFQGTHVIYITRQEQVALVYTKTTSYIWIECLAQPFQGTHETRASWRQRHVFRVTTYFLNIFVACVKSVEGLNVITVLNFLTFGPKFAFNQVEVLNV